jgi:hypothetical protein
MFMKSCSTMAVRFLKQRYLAIFISPNIWDILQAYVMNGKILG